MSDVAIVTVNRDISNFHSRLVVGDDENLEQVIIRSKKLHYNNGKKLDSTYPPTSDNEGVSFSDVRNVFAEVSGRRIPLAAFGLGTSEDQTRVGFLAKKTPPTGLLSGDKVPACALTLLGEDQSHHILRTERTGLESAGTVNPTQLGIPDDSTDSDALFGIILSPTEVKFGQ
ncbi:MAG: hypothetical protein ACLFWB_11440 [Armatimonadota bacterium]